MKVRSPESRARAQRAASLRVMRALRRRRVLEIWGPPARLLFACGGPGRCAWAMADGCRCVGPGRLCVCLKAVWEDLVEDLGFKPYPAPMRGLLASLVLSCAALDAEDPSKGLEAKFRLAHLLSKDRRASRLYDLQRKRLTRLVASEPAGLLAPLEDPVGGRP